MSEDRVHIPYTAMSAIMSFAHCSDVTFFLDNDKYYVN